MYSLCYNFNNGAILVVHVEKNRKKSSLFLLKSLIVLVHFYILKKCRYCKKKKKLEKQI